MSNLHTIDNEKELFVLKCVDGKGEITGYTCLGFDVAIKWTEGVAKWLGLIPPQQSLRGTAEYYAAYLEIMQKGREFNQQTGQKCLVCLNPQLICLEGKIVEVSVDGEENYRFQVGRSTGWMPCHLEIESPRADGGTGARNHYNSVKVVTSFKMPK